MNRLLKKSAPVKLFKHRPTDTSQKNRVFGEIVLTGNNKWYKVCTVLDKIVLTGKKNCRNFGKIVFMLTGNNTFKKSLTTKFPVFR